MDSRVFTMRDLEETRRRARYREQARRGNAELRNGLMVFALFAACWLARYWFISL